MCIDVSPAPRDKKDTQKKSKKKKISIDKQACKNLQT